jgi:hypothetical protein
MRENISHGCKLDFHYLSLQRALYEYGQATFVRLKLLKPVFSFFKE